MSFAEIKQQVPNLSAGERYELAVILAEITDRENEAEWAEELERRNARMDAGEKYTLEDLERRHAELIAQGR